MGRLVDPNLPFGYDRGNLYTLIPTAPVTDRSKHQGRGASCSARAQGCRIGPGLALVKYKHAQGLEGSPFVLKPNPT